MLAPRSNASPYDCCDACTREGAPLEETATGALYCSETCARRHHRPACAAFKIIAAEAVRVGWPTSYRRDLTLHDRRFLAALPEGTAFLWVLRELGTHVVADVPPGANEDGYGNCEAIIRAVTGTYDGARMRCYHYDGRRLIEVSPADALAVARRFDKARAKVAA